MDARGLKILRDSTTWFIAQDPTEIVLIPHSSPAVGPGGGLVAQPGTPRAPQRVKLSLPGGDNKSSGEGGDTHVENLVMVMEWNAVVATGDTWTEGDRTYTVDGFETYNKYEIKALVSARGANKQNG